MAESDDGSIEGNEDMVRQRIDEEGRRRERKKSSKSPGRCRPIYDRLATPNRRLVLALYQNHAYHLPKDKVENIKQKLQELYAMTPEETERYFKELQCRAYIAARKKMLKGMLRKEYLKKRREQQIAKAMRRVEKIIKCGMTFAFYNAIPPLVSIRLRNLSNIVLEQLCDLMNVDIPNRESYSVEEGYLICVADWMAIAIERVYYGAQLKKNIELEQIEKEREEMVKNKKGSATSPMKTPTTGGEKDYTLEGEDDEDELEQFNLEAAQQNEMAEN